ncbi:MAG: hypothetical protein QM683_14275 [Lacrimispora sp.]
MGYISGNDFVIIIRDMERSAKLCDDIIGTFAGQIEAIYFPYDWDRG